MTAMEKMIASMLGISPAEMQEMLTGFKTLLTDLGGSLAAIKKTGEENAAALAAIQAQLSAPKTPAKKGAKNDGPIGNDADHGDGATGRSGAAGDGDAGPSGDGFIHA